MPFESVCVSVQGASHVKRDVPREDYGATAHSSYFDVFAVADGHGDSNCPRSDLGSRFACEIAIEHLSTFAQSLRSTASDDGSGTWEDKLAGPKSGRLVRQLVTSIVGHWNEKVADHFEANPLTEDERAGCDRYLERYDAGERVEHIYGTTLIAGLFTDTYLLLLQQGDGRCVLFDERGDATQPIPWDDRCVANVCTSLCDTDAIESFRYYLAPRSELSVAACLAGSDGVEDSFFSMDQLHSFYRELLCLAAQDGVAALGEHLETFLPELSAKGSQDDITVCGLIDPELVAPLVPAFERQNKLVAAQSQHDRLVDRLQSMSGKMEYLQNRYEAAHARAESWLELWANDDAAQELETAERELREYEDLRTSFVQALAETDDLIRVLEAPATSETAPQPAPEDSDAS